MMILKEVPGILVPCAEFIHAKNKQKYSLMQENFNTNFQYMFFDYEITFVNSQNAHTNQKS